MFFGRFRALGIRLRYVIMRAVGLLRAPLRCGFLQLQAVHHNKSQPICVICVPWLFFQGKRAKPCTSLTQNFCKFEYNELQI